MIDLDRVRRETPGCEAFIHFDNAGASPMPEPVFRSVTGHLDAERAVGGYEAERRAKPALDSFYTGIARLLNAGPDEIAFAENATRAWDMAVYALPLKEGDRVITHGSEYASNMLAFLQLAARWGIGIDIAPSDESGQIDVAALDRLVTSRTKVIALTHVPTQGGLVNPAEEVGAIARKHGLIYVLDACQSVGQIDIDVSKIGCDILTCTGRKYLRGPRGTGFLYIGRRLAERLDPPFIDLHSAVWTGERRYDMASGARRFENYESNVAGRIGLAKAVDYSLAIGLPDIEARVSDLAATLRRELARLPGIDVHDLGDRKCGIVTFSAEGLDPFDLRSALFQRNISTSVSTAEHALLDLGRRGTGPINRASVHYFNTEQEIDRFLSAVLAVQKDL
ncbi:aminotransferase class V-fold PLP-dependent enzyme [Roseibium sp. Sym1]|uniref:aminotransferase class V-fold PLP-dependent enzyme n=1 Tax=Roseibium sp. Sym1 TaxID=3016006 RepID=UPI0022B2EAA8|nr:aminotransferase class V-fold PLP-dependent enzyme [Roseibium sp. Sym1]